MSSAGQPSAGLDKIDLQRHAASTNRRARTSLSVAMGLALGALATVGLSGTELKAPDTSSPPAATIMQPVNNWRSVGQTFRAERDGLSRIEVVLAAGGRAGDAPLHFQIKDGPDGEPIRTVLAHRDSMPVGDPWWFTPGRIGERWFGFDFEPIPDSADRQLYFGLEGPGIPQDGTVNTLLFFFNGYPEGQAYVNGEPVNAHMVFRAYSRATPLEALNRILGNLAFQRPGILGGPMTYAALAIAYLVMGLVLMRKVWLACAGVAFSQQTGQMRGYEPDGQQE